MLNQVDLYEASYENKQNEVAMKCPRFFFFRSTYKYVNIAKTNCAVSNKASIECIKVRDPFHVRDENGNTEQKY